MGKIKLDKVLGGFSTVKDQLTQYLTENALEQQSCKEQQESLELRKVALQKEDERASKALEKITEMVG